MKILAMDTSSVACSVALTDNKEIIERHEILGNRHSAHLLKFVDQLLNQCGLTLNDLDAIAVGCGPGSFTGLRLGIGVAQGLSFSIQKPLIAVSSMLAIAENSSGDDVFVAVDARMGEVYWQCFQTGQSGELYALGEPQVDKPQDITITDADLSWQGIGSGFDEYPDPLTTLLGESGRWDQGVYPRASCIIKLALNNIERYGMPAGNSVFPVYVRNNVTY